MLSIRRIVIGIDLIKSEIGPTAQLVIEQAKWIALEFGAHITLVHSYRDDEIWVSDSETYEAWREPEASQWHQSLEQAADSLRSAGVECEVVETADTPGHAIVQQVLREGADLAIVGKRVNHLHDGRRIGSVSLNVIRHCPCLVSVVKPGSSPRPSIIVAASDGGPVGSRVVDAAAGLAASSGATLHVIHAIQKSMEVQMEGDEAEREFVRTRRKELHTQAQAQATAAGLKTEVQTHAGITSPTRAVLEAVEKLDPDLVVMGTISRGGIPGLLVGNTAERLLGTLDCSLLVAKPADFICPVTPD